MAAITIGVVGFGRFGELWARALAPLGRVVVFDEKWNETEGPPRLAPGLTAGTLTEVAASEVVFVAVPISRFEDCCQGLAQQLSPQSILVDVLSVKLYPMKVMHSVLPKEQPLIGTHPLFGPDSVARLGLSGRKIVLSPLRANPTQTNTVRSLLEGLKLQIIETTPENHDRQMARSQALVHLLGRAFATLKLEKQEISTPDYESLLNINSLVNNDTWQLFFDMQCYNPYASEMRVTLRNSLDDLEERIRQRTAQTKRSP